MAEMLNGKVAVVVGGGTGIGAAAARLLAAEGADIIVAGASAGEADATCTAIAEANGSAVGALCDVTDRESVTALFKSAASSHGQVDIVVNSAGIFHQTPAFDTDPAHIDRLIAVNLVGAMNVIYASLGAMRGRGGAIVTVSSTQAVLAEPACAVYAATKRGIEHFTASLAPELKDSRIRVNCVAPGATRTPMTTPMLGPESKPFLDALVRNGRSPWGEFFLEPEHVAQCILFLVSDAAWGVQGTSLVADQGHTSALPALPV